MWLNNPSRSSLGKNISRLPSLPIQSPESALTTFNLPLTCLPDPPRTKTGESSYTIYIIIHRCTHQQSLLKYLWFLCGHAPHVHAQTFNLISGYTKIPGKKWDIGIEEHLYLLLGLHPTPRASKTFVPDAHWGKVMTPRCFVWWKKCEFNKHHTYLGFSSL